MKKYAKYIVVFVIIILVVILAFAAYGSGNHDSHESYDYNSYDSNDSNNPNGTNDANGYNNSNGSYNSYDSYDSNGAQNNADANNIKDDVQDWMKDEAQGKSHDYDDGGDYYCMGKGDTCPNKTHNAYDLFCDSCDPDNDNIEG